MGTKQSIVVLAVVVLGALPVWADETRGIVSKVDPQKKEILIEARGKGMRGEHVLFSLDDNTRYLAGRRAAQLADVSPGRRVRIQYDSRDGKKLAARVELLGGAAVASQPSALEDNAVAGTLRSIDRTEREIVVVAPGSEVTLAVAPDAVVTRDGKAIAFDDLKEEQQVAVKVEMQGDRRVAKAIVVGVKVDKEKHGVERAREILKRIDEVLQQLEQRRQLRP